jgi:hypothetical protein
MFNERVHVVDENDEVLRTIERRSASDDDILRVTGNFHCQRRR